MRDYVAQLPDYTCRVTLERFARRSARAPFALSDRIRLEVAYAGGEELYSWPDAGRFAARIEDLLPGHGMMSNGSYALHMRNLFVRDVATFSAPHDERCEGRGCVRVDFDIPASRSGYFISSGGSAARAPLVGSAWFDRESLDIMKLEVRVDDTSVGIASTRETTTYAHAIIGDREFVLPATSELLLKDRNGAEMRNASVFDRYHRYAGSATIFYGAGADARRPAPAPTHDALPEGKSLTAMLDGALREDCAIGDPVGVTTREGTHYTVRIVGMRQAGKRWLIDLRVGNLVRTSLQLPLAAGHGIMFRTDKFLFYRRSSAAKDVSGKT
ncbi:MAG: hypothetical protein JWP63_5309 [Candidatus Solibacter sp.]|nr:hypothetical protein [Candidatus Solibacter sp.]